MIRKLENYILENWLWIIIGCVLTNRCIELAYRERGHKAIGGEYMVLPLLLMVVHLVRDITKDIRLLLSEEGEDDE